MADVDVVDLVPASRLSVLGQEGFILVYLFLFFRADTLPSHGDVERNTGPSAAVDLSCPSNSNSAVSMDSNRNNNSHGAPTAARPRPRPRPCPDPAVPSSLFLTNVRSLMPKLSELRVLLDTVKPSPHILVVTENWLSSCISDSAVCHALPGFSVLRQDRSDGHLGGGVATFIRDGIRFCRRQDLEQWSEDLWIEFPVESLGRRKSLLLGCVYRTPSSNVQDFISALDSSLHQVDHSREEVLLVGDFNASSPPWLPSASYNAAGASLEPAFLQFGLTQHVHQPTHLRPDGQDGSTLDLVLSSSPNSVSSVTTLPPLGKSDHCVLHCIFDFSPSTHQVCTRLRRLWAYGEADFADVNRCLLAADWSLVSSAATVDGAWAAWKATFLDIVQK